ATIYGGPYDIPYNSGSDPDPPLPTELEVYNTGTIEVDDEVWIGTTANVLLVTDVNHELRKIWVSNFDVDPSISVIDGARLIRKDARPDIWLNNSMGYQCQNVPPPDPVEGSYLDTDTTGQVQCYVAAY